MYSIWKHFRFAASHQLSGLPDGHQCGRLHGHNYTIEVELAAATLNWTGFVRDFGELKAVRQFIDEHWEHRHLNDYFDNIEAGINPTAEIMAQHLYSKMIDLLPELVAVRVQETETSWAEYRP
jgi:6-pyruvoyltetrahydropterin/6-carboxytetrahydropterin synthase